LIAGLLVLAVLLLAGVQPSMAMLPNAHHYETGVAGQTLTAAIIGDMTAPVHDDDCDHDLCCIGGHCVAHAYWIPARVADLPSPLELGVVGQPTHTLLLNGIATPPPPPPPRAMI
jgi:hypothetical protein